jgi:hypothetical protein
MNSFYDCPWFLRVSALADGELSNDEAELVRAHALSCDTCKRVSDFHELGVKTPGEEKLRSQRDTVFMVVRPLPMRILLGIFGFSLVVFGVFNFVRGSDSGEGLHNLRHLGIWQGSLGVSVVLLSVFFRLSLFITATAVSFLVLTTVAFIVDLILGHSGPWTDYTHIVEVLAVVFLLVLTKPRAKLSSEARRQLGVLHND